MGTSALNGTGVARVADDALNGAGRGQRGRTLARSKFISRLSYRPPLLARRCGISSPRRRGGRQCAVFTGTAYFRGRRNNAAQNGTRADERNKFSNAAAPSRDPLESLSAGGRR